MHHLTLYGKAGCHLCHEARDLLLALKREYEFALTEVDISTDRALEAQYRYSVPVIVVDSEIELAAPIYERELRAVLSRQ